MSKPIPLQQSFDRMVRDKSRDNLGQNECWDIVDYLPNLGAPLRKRGGWSYEGSSLTSLNASCLTIHTVGFAPFSAGVKTYAIDNEVPRLLDLTSGADRGAVVVPWHTPTFYRDLVIIPFASGNTAIYKWAGGTSAPAALGGSPPIGRASCVYKDRLVLANSSSFLNRLWFSGAGNPESWDTTNRYLDTSSLVVGLAPLRNCLLVFHPGSVERIRGSIPPGSAAADMTLEPLFGEVGMFWSPASLTANCLAVADDYAYFADESGVYQTDGSSLVDLTQRGGLKNYWQEKVSATGGTPVISLGVSRGYLFICVVGQTTLMYRIRDRSFIRLANVDARNFAAVTASHQDKILFSNSGTPRAGDLSTIFSPASGVKNDADGDAVAPVLETGVFDLGSFYLKQFTDIYLNYDVRDASSDNPTLTVSYLSDPAETSFTSLSPTLAETTTRTRARLPLNQTKYGVALKVAQSNASSDTRLYGIEADVSLQEGTDLV